ncbi:phosphoribosyltransferase family protein [Anaeromyxobacter soli]|uniref:phosphoribosyltransferase family protein n=1 Tax=Anaeromyxobacter soli TaxID=2922725 RepID=UPI001FAEA4B5|nr:phosphoribosyltransferase family protein [Anaeromyxobacter sp. SG29]
MIFDDRSQAGRLLAAALEGYRGERPVVLGLTRGGVPVAYEVARALGAPLDVLVVRKLGAPGDPEYAVGAIAEGGAVYVSRDAVRETGLSEEEVAVLAEREAAELQRRVRAYRGSREPPDVAARTVILVDDGVATGATARAAARAARRWGAARVALAAPVIAAQTAAELRPDLDDVVALERPRDFRAVGAWYRRFAQVGDAEVLSCVERARREAGDEELWGGDWNAPGGEEEPASEAAPEVEERYHAVPFDGSRRGPGALEAALAVPMQAAGLVAFVHGSGASRRSPRDRHVARALQRAGLATLLFDLLTPEERAEDQRSGELRFDLELLAGRAVAAVRWAAAHPDTRALRLGLFGAGTGAAVALLAAAAEPERVAAVVSRGGRPDLVDPATLRRIAAPVLLVVGKRDGGILARSSEALPFLRQGALEIVPGASHLFDEAGALDAVARQAARFFTLHLGRAQASGAPPPR